MNFISSQKMIWLLIASYILVFGIFVSLRHYNFQTQAWDLGIFVQTFWNTINGRFLTNNIEGIKQEGIIKNHFGVHMSPFLILLVPGYALFPTPYYLLIIQTVALALG